MAQIGIREYFAANTNTPKVYLGDIPVGINTTYAPFEIEYLVVAGGASGGQLFEGPGGGAGGLVSGSMLISGSTTYTVVVGQGGDQNGTQKNSDFFNITAIKGGKGGLTAGENGGSGGGGGYDGGKGGLGTVGQGFPGGSGSLSSPDIGGGGGGAGEAGNTDGQGHGGDGKQSAIDGTLKYYAGGGGGYNLTTSTSLPGGEGGGGTASQGTDGLGGGGAACAGWCRGGHGTVIIRYQGPQIAVGGDSVYEDNGYTVHKYTTIGSASFSVS